MAFVPTNHDNSINQEENITTTVGVQESAKRKFEYFQEEAAKVIQHTWKTRFQFQTLKFKAYIFQEFYSANGLLQSLSSDRMREYLKSHQSFRVERIFTLHLFKCITCLVPDFTMKCSDAYLVTGFLFDSDLDSVVTLWCKKYGQIRSCAGEMIKFMDKILLHIAANKPLHELSIRPTLISFCKSIQQYADNDYKTALHHKKMNDVKKFKFDIYVKHALCREYENFKKGIHYYREVLNCKQNIKTLFDQFYKAFPAEAAAFSLKLESQVFDNPEDLQQFCTEHSLLSVWDTCEPEVAQVQEFDSDVLAHELLLDPIFTSNSYGLKGCFTHSAVQLQDQFEKYSMDAIAKEFSGIQVSEVPFFHTYTKLYRMRQWLAQIVPGGVILVGKKEVMDDLFISKTLHNHIIERYHWTEIVYMLEKYMNVVNLANIPPEHKAFFMAEWKIFKNAMLNCESDLEWPSMVAQTIAWIHSCICCIHKAFIQEFSNKFLSTVQLHGIQWELDYVEQEIMYAKQNTNKLTEDITHFINERFSTQECREMIYGGEKQSDLPERCNVLLMVKYLFETVPLNKNLKDILPDSLGKDFHSFLEMRSTLRFILMANNVMSRLALYQNNIDNFDVVSLFHHLHFS